MRLLFALLTVFTLLVLCTQPILAAPVTGISFNKSSTTINTGNSETLVATVSPFNATNKNFTLASTNTAVAIVNSSGLVTAIGGGICAITATTQEGAYVAWCVVTVPSIPVTGISFNKSTTTLYVGDSETLIATVAPSNATNKNVTFASTNNAVAIVDTDGNVTAVGDGICAITATTVDGEYVAWCVVTVPYIPVTGISLNRTTINTLVFAGDNETLIATVYPANASYKTVTWGSTNNAVATVDSNGKVTAVGGGTCAITATTDDGAYVAWCVITIYYILIT